MYGAVMSWTDGVIAVGFELATTVPMEEVQKISEQLKDESNNPRDYKMKLAYEIVKINNGEETAKKAQDDFVAKFQKGDIPKDIGTIEQSTDDSIVSAVVNAGLAESNADAKRKIKQGGVEIDGKKINVDTEATKEMDGKILKVGKKDFRKIKIID